MYRVYLRAGERLTATATKAPTGVVPSLSLWRPGAPAVDPALASSLRILARPAGTSLSYRASLAGWYLIEARLTHASRGSYRLAVTKSR